MSVPDVAPWDSMPRKLSPDEIKMPEEVIHDFFSYVKIPQAREHFWELLKCTVTGTYNSLLSRKERADLFYFLEQVERLIEAAHLIHQQRKA